MLLDIWILKIIFETKFGFYDCIQCDLRLPKHGVEYEIELNSSDNHIEVEFDYRE